MLQDLTVQLKKILTNISASDWDRPKLVAESIRGMDQTTRIDLEIAFSNAVHSLELIRLAVAQQNVAMLRKD